MTPQETQQIRRRLREKIVCLNRMLPLAQAQPSALHTGTAPLLTNLKEMTKLIHKVDGIDRTLNPLDAQLTAGEREKFLPEFREIKTLLHQLMTLEKESILQVRDRMSNLRREINQRQQGHRAAKKYSRRHSPSTARFLDLREG